MAGSTALPSRSWPTTWSSGPIGGVSEHGANLERAGPCGRPISAPRLRRRATIARLRPPDPRARPPSATVGGVLSSLRRWRAMACHLCAQRANRGDHLADPARDVAGQLLVGLARALQRHHLHGCGVLWGLPAGAGTARCDERGDGAITGTANMVPNGCIGGGIWSSPTVDTSAGTIWVTTGTPHACSNGIDLRPCASWSSGQVICPCSGTGTCPSPARVPGTPTSASTPTLFTATINGQVRSLVGAVNKDAIFYALGPDQPRRRPGVAVDGRHRQWGSLRSDRSCRRPGTAAISTWEGGPPPSTGRPAGQSRRPEPFDRRVRVAQLPIESTLRGHHRCPRRRRRGNSGRHRGLPERRDRQPRSSPTRPGSAKIQGECAVSNGIVYIPLDNGSLVALGQ